MSLDTIAFVLGGLLVGAALLGGGIEVRELKIPSLGRLNRAFSLIGGVLFIGLAVFLREAPDKKAPVTASVESIAVAPKTQGARPDQSTPPASPRADWMTAAQYQQEFKSQVKDGFYPSRIEGKCEDGSESYRAQWKGSQLGSRFWSHHTLTKDGYEKKNQEYTADGFVLEFLTKYRDCAGVDRYLATWVKRPRP